MAELPRVDARRLLRRLTGSTLRTVTGNPNTILEIRENHVLVGTVKSPNGTPVPIAWVQDALDRLSAEGEIEISVESLGYRSAFVGAVLLALPNTRLTGDRRAHVVIEAGDQGGYRREAAGEVNEWWSGDPEERYWLEITDRVDIGVDLHAPQRDAGSKRSPGYSLMWWVEPGDVIFHYDLNERAITAWSRTVGEVVEAPVVWLSHRSATRRRIGTPRPQPGWWLDLDGPYPLSRPLTLDGLRERGEQVRDVLKGLQAAHAGSLYFPFFFYGGTQLRPMQPYLNKLPAALVRALPELTEAARQAAATVPITATTPQAEGVGASYRMATATVLPEAREPFSVDPALVERGLRGHVDAQNGAAEFLEAAGIEPRSPRPDEPNFDLAWSRDGVVFVAEIKSITPQNADRQLRLGLGQVLRYRALLRQRHEQVEAVLIVEREPRDASWRELCNELGVEVVAAPDYDGLLG